MGKFTQKTIGVLASAPAALKAVEQEAVTLATPTTTFVQKIAEDVITDTKTVVEPVVQFVDREVQIIKEVPVEVIKYVDKEVIKFIDVPVHVIREVEKLIEVPVEKIREVQTKVVTTVHKIPYWMWMLSAMELLAIILLIIK